MPFAPARKSYETMKLALYRSKLFRLPATVVVIVASLLGVVLANGEDDHGPPASASSAAATGTIAVARAERNIDTDSGKFLVRIERYPADPREGELVQIAVRVLEKVEGGFGANEPIAIEDAVVSITVTTADGGSVAANVPAIFEKGFYRADHSFAGDGDFKIVANVAPKDNRTFSADFPVSVANAPIRWSFWLGLLILSLVSFGTVGAVYYSMRNVEDRGAKMRRLAPVTALALLFFAFGVVALAYLSPPRETRAMGNFVPSGEAATNAADTGTLSVLTIPKESQLLFGIKTEPVSTRRITSGMNVTGTVRSRPDARAVIVPPVAGRVVLREGLSLGAAVGRGEQIGYVEQVLDVSGQTELESQRLEVAAQQREVEARRLEIRNSVLQLQGQQAEQRAKAQQSRTQLAQAQRELRRAANLVEVGAVPVKRLEEARTAVSVAEQDVSAADQQVRSLESQIRQTRAGETIFQSPRVNAPSRSFPLTSPVTGIVNDIKATSGQVVETGAELMSVVNLSTVLIEAQVFERDLPAVRESTRASFTSAALGDEVYTVGTPDGDGRLVSIGQAVNEQTRTVPVIYEVKNPLNRLKDGMFVEITIDTSGERQVLAVPKSAVVNEQGQTFVFVFDGGETFRKRAVALGSEGADYFEVNSGLEEGERVVTEGIYQLRSTQPSA
ncbi:MAG: Multidrug resistance protein MdtA [Pyrinomonadaceae bacterium]|nr:Multidrug resistance protein MdtA [Pyrinomonadaceae bacterium]